MQWIKAQGDFSARSNCILFFFSSVIVSATLAQPDLVLSGTFFTVRKMIPVNRIKLGTMTPLGLYIKLVLFAGANCHTKHEMNIQLEFSNL